MPSVSLVIPSRTGRIDRLRAQLARQSLQGWELIVKRGIAPAARARNLGAQEASGEWMIFLDDDVTFGSLHVLEQVANALASLQPGSAVGVPCQIPPAANPFQRRAIRESFESVLGGGPDSSLTEVSWMAVGTACFGIAKQTFEELGGFDEALTSGEDYELCYRLRRRGGRVYAVTDGRIHHAPPATFREALAKTLWYERGNAQVVRKHPDSGYRMRLRGWWHAALYLAGRTVALLPLCVLQVSYHHRRPRLAWRPTSAFLSYLGAWAYCIEWFAQRPPDAARCAPLRPQTSRSDAHDPSTRIPAVAGGLHPVPNMLRVPQGEAQQTGHSP